MNENSEIITSELPIEEVVVPALPINRRVGWRALSPLATDYLSGVNVQGLEFDPNSPNANIWNHNLRSFANSVARNQDYGLSPHTQYNIAELHDLARHFNNFNLNNSLLNTGNIRPRRMLRQYMSEHPETSQEDQNALLNEYERLQSNERNNRREFRRARRVAGSDRQSLSDREFYSNLGNFVTGIVAAPAIMNTMPHLLQVMNNPVVQTIGTATGMYNLFTNNGIAKTYRLARDGNYGRAAVSFLGDLLDASPYIGAFRTARNINRLRNLYDLRTGLKYGVSQLPGMNLLKSGVNNNLMADIVTSNLPTPTIRTGYHWTRHHGDSQPFLQPTTFFKPNNINGKTTYERIVLDTYNPVRFPNDELPTNYIWKGGNDLNFVTTSPESFIHVGSNSDTGLLRMRTTSKWSNSNLPPVQREVTWLEYPGTQRQMPDIGSWYVDDINSNLFKQIGLDDNTLTNLNMRRFNNTLREDYGQHGTTLELAMYDNANNLLNAIRNKNISSLRYNNLFEIPKGWRHINDTTYSLPSGRPIIWDGSQSYAIATPDVWVSKNRFANLNDPDIAEINFSDYID